MCCFSVHQETLNIALGRVIVQNIDNDVDSDDKVDVAPPSDVASISSKSHQGQNDCESTANRRHRAEYDPSIWDFLSPAARDHDEEDDDENDDADDDDDGGGGGGGTQLRLLTPREVDMRPVKHAKAVLEIVDTEISYANDLAIIKRVRNVNESTTVATPVAILGEGG